MRAIFSAYVLASRLGQPLTVVWVQKDELYCPFKELFVLDSRVKVVETEGKPSFKTKVSYHLSDISYQDQDIQKMRQKTGYPPMDQLEGKRNIYIRTGYMLCPVGNYSELFTPCPDIRRKAAAFEDCLGKGSVGVHIRRTDNEKAIQYSKRGSFEKVLMDEIRKNPEVRFFLSTDSREELDYFCEKFGKRVFAQMDIERMRNSKEAIRSALVDLLCLAGTEKIIGSYWSSFTDVASEFYGIEKFVVQESEKV